ncbi:MAG: hypothetical protein E7J67_05935, partial [Veillonella sp.]|nr:hypothetical protein [Veillonella sp.]
LSPSNGYLHGVSVDVTFESGYASRHFCTMKTKKVDHQHVGDRLVRSCLFSYCLIVSTYKQ